MSHPVALAVADFNGDGKPDLAAVSFQDFCVSIMLNTGNGTFQSASDAANFAVFGFPVAGAVADFNGDGKPDLVTSGGAVTVLTNLTR